MNASQPENAGAPRPPDDAVDRRVEPENAPRRLTVIYNPVAGWRRRKRLHAVLSELDSLGCRVALRETGAPGDAESMARALAEEGEADVLVAAGGDGTVNEIVNGLAGSRLPLGLIPLGTANVLAREIRQELDAASIARTLAWGRPLEVAAGEANGRMFLLMAGVGFDARVVADIRPGVKRLFGKGAYVLAGLSNWLAGRFPRYRVTIDGKSHDAYSAVLANAHFYGGSYVLAPDARLEDPSLRVCLFEKPGRLAVVRYALAMQFGRLPHARGYRILPAEEVAVEASAPDREPVQGDGDVLTQLPLSARIRPAAVRLIVPEAYPRS
jgi:YegS/Rv2252/BmrU family lipid kinase